jgi:benzoyl-CoA reductase subunit B
MPDKQLASTVEAAEHQKRAFGALRQAVFEQREPYAIVQADVPFEIFQVMGVPAVSNQWWAALIAAKRQAGAYLDLLTEAGYHDGLCRYCSLGLASTLFGDRQPPPWGGLPPPRLLCARLTCDCIQRVFHLWADALGAELFLLDSPGATHLPPRWWDDARRNWRELVEPHRVELMTAQLRSLIARLEKISGRTFDIDTLRAVMQQINTQEEIFEEVRDLICAAPKTPVRMTEQIANVMPTQWERGSPWALEHAGQFRDEVRQRVEQGIAACPNERFRLMWVGAGLWHDTDFYTAFEANHGAVFVWSMYLAFGPDGYIRYGLDDPLAALASRITNFNEQLHNPPWAGEWVVDQAVRHRIDAALVLRPTTMPSAATGRLFIEKALERAGIAVLPIEADVVDPRAWNPEAMRQRVRRFIEEQLQ